jgi:hypothetical protein
MEEKGTYQVTGRKNFNEWFESEEFKTIQERFKEHQEKDKQEAETFWNNLSYEDQLRAFYYVCSKIYEGDVEKSGSYRFVLYDIFGFDLDSYVLGMDCQYIIIHNLLFDGVEFSKMKTAKEIVFQSEEGSHTFTAPEDKIFDFTFDEGNSRIVINTKKRFNIE